MRVGSGCRGRCAPGCDVRRPVLPLADAGSADAFRLCEGGVLELSGVFAGSFPSTKVWEIAAMLKAIHASEDITAARNACRINPGLCRSFGRLFLLRLRDQPGLLNGRVVVRFGFGWRNVSDGLQQLAVGETSPPFPMAHFEWPPWATAMDDFRLEQTDHAADRMRLYKRCKRSLARGDWRKRSRHGRAHWTHRFCIAGTGLPILEKPQSATYRCFGHSSNLRI